MSRLKKLTFFIGLLPFLMVLGNSMLIPILPAIERGLNLTAGQGSLVLSLFSFPAAIIIPFAGFLSDRYGRKRMIAISLWLIITGSVICAASAYFPGYGLQVLLAGRFIQGAGAAGTTPLAMALAGDLFTGGERAESLGILEVYNGVGKVAAPIIGAAAAMISWGAVFWVFPVIGGLSYWGIRKNIKTHASGKELESMKEYAGKLKSVFIRKAAILIPLFLLGGIGLFLLFGLLYFLSYHIQDTYHIDGFFKGFSFMFPLGALTLTSYWTGNELKSNPDKKSPFLLLGTTVQFLMFGCILLFPSFSALLFFLTVAFSGLGFILPSLNLIITSSVDDGERGLVVSLYGTARFLGVALGPIVYGAWITSEHKMFLYTFLISVLSIVLYAVFRFRNYGWSGWSWMRKRFI
ncbi:MFS transporter [Falsibacillus pallidus]|uniref:ACDE family multidrug resistance protein n=1 Tax=Falsibacillus pallidus TaxID=493781 RepID=A0A370GPU8_9BACI|nr:MFS transporter [Falsibacillus pallidus]RDI43973.1 ACDE family multidrug resistance protein [Falsibacillus pallidus]